MKVLAVSVLALLLLVGLPVTSDSRDHVRCVSIHHEGHLNNVSIDIDDGVIILTHDGRRRETVEITEDYELYVNDEKIDLDEDQQVLVTEYYELGMDIVACAKRIGWEGAKIGVSGAKLGLNAVGNVFKLIFTNYDTDDFEREMEREAARLEARAEVLEEKAEVIEDMAIELEDIAYDMNREIPQLRALDWF
ncbi:MAG: hypothetical protein V3T31_07860 [candidate division Zixibacteria bacterium]